MNSLKDERDFGVCLYSGAGGNDPDLTVIKQSLRICIFTTITITSTTTWRPSSWPWCWRPGVPAVVHGAQAALPHRRRPTWGGQFQGGIWPTCQTSSSQFSIVWIVQITVAWCYECFCSLWNAEIKFLFPASIRVCLFCERRLHAGVQVFETKIRIVNHCQGAREESC